MDLFSDHVPLLRPWIDEEDLLAVAEVMRSGWLSLGPKVKEFEDRVAALLGAPHAVAVNSATSAIYLAFRVSGLLPGDQVIVPAHTCMATVNAVIMAGGEPLFADIDPRTFNLDPAAVATLLTSKVRAICLVHQIGLPGDIEAFQNLARRHNLLLVEDAATAFGSRYQGRYLGGHGNPTAFSFHPRKMITTGEGGMVVLWDEQAAERACRLRSAGASISDLVRHQAKGVLQQTYPEPGFNFRMTDMQAALGLSQLRKLPAMLALRAEQAAFYDEALSGLEGVMPPYVPPGAVPCYSSYCVTLPWAGSEHLTTVLEYMAGKGISCRRGIQPLYQEPYFEATHAGFSLPGTEAAAAQTMFLPIFPGLRRGQQERVVSALREAISLIRPRAAAA
jgi:dTDP-4-amino-4,6-dideoxygalactose transaminase